MELFTLFGRIAIEGSDEANKKISEVTGQAEDSGNKIGGAFEKIGGAVLKAGAIVGAGIGTMATGIGILSKQSISAYADFEQLVGGVETLFGAGGQSIEEYADSVGKTVDEISDKYNELIKSQDTVLENSQNAFRTCGLSANEYMETVTSFSASLIASLNGDTVKASEKADQVLVQMADNANKMGSTMESIQNAYNGFAKQNYTMLDNLKLGYGGTKEEMQRLLKDAEKMPEALGRKFDISNYADIVDAIKLVQDNMGITGTTAKEASSTISGSISMMKASWQNFLTGMADDEADFSQLMDNLVDSVVTVANNIAPRLVETVPRLVEGLTQVVEKLIPYIVPMIEQLLPPLLEGAVKLIVYLVQNLPAILQLLGSALWDALQVMFSEIGELLPETVTENFSAISEGFNAIWQACQFVWESIGKPIWDAIQFAIGLVKDTFTEYMPEIQAFFTQAVSDISDSWNNHLKPCLEAIGNFLNTVLKPVFESVFKGFVVPLVKYVFGFIKTTWESVLKPVFNGICDFLTGVFTGNWKLAFDGIVGIVKGAVNAVIGGVELMVNNVIMSINKLLAGISAVATTVGSLLGLDPVSLSLDYVTLPRLAKGGVLEKGQMGFLEGDGAEAVVPLDQNKKWIASVANDMETAGIGGGSGTLDVMKQILEVLQELRDDNASLPETLVDAMAGNLTFAMNNREFARLVKAVN